MAPEGRKRWPDLAIAHLTECNSNWVCPLPLTELAQSTLRQSPNLPPAPLSLIHRCWNVSAQNSFCRKVYRVERRLHQEPKKDLPLPKVKLRSKAADSELWRLNWLKGGNSFIWDLSSVEGNIGLKLVNPSKSYVLHSDQNSGSQLVFTENL